MVALELWRATRCPACGGDMHECCAPDAAFTVASPRRCHKTTALAIAQDQSQRKQPEALLWRVERR